MARTLLDICQDLCERIGLPHPENIINGEEGLAPQYLALLNETARDLMRREDWQAIIRVATFTSVATERQALMTVVWPGFRRMVKGSFLNTTQGRRVTPIDARQHATLILHGSPLTSSLYRIRGNELLFPVTAVAGEAHRFEYVSNLWVVSADGTEDKARPTRDTDFLLLDDEALILGAKWRWKKESGLAYGEDFTDYEKLVQELQGSDRESAPLTIGGRGGGSFSFGGMSQIENGGIGDDPSSGPFFADSTDLTTDSISIDGSGA